MPEDKLTKLKELLKVANDGLSKEEFLKAFKAVMDHVSGVEALLVKKIDAKTQEVTNETERMVSLMEGLRAQFIQTIKETKSANESTFTQIKQRSMESIAAMFTKMDIQGQMDKMYAEHEEMMQKCEESMPNVEELKKEIIEEQERETPESLRDKLESLKNDERTDKSAIKGIEELERKIKELETRISSIPRGGSAPRTAGAGTIFEDLSSLTDGSNKVYPVTKNLGGVVISSDFPTVLMENNGFTVNAARNQITLTTVNAPSAGSQLVFIGKSLFN